MGDGFALRYVDASAEAFHQRDLPAEAAVWVVRLSGPALVLGSRQQPEEHAVLEAARGWDAAVVRRRSGGGAVWLAPGEHVWVDVVVPTGHPRWEPDVGRSMWWVGEAWSAALDAAGVRPTTVHRGGMVQRPWSDAVCFAGVGPGEVLDGQGRKLVGVSQRRTRTAARFQCALLARWDPLPYASLVRAAPPVHDLADVAAGVGAAADAALAAFTRRLCG